MRSGRAGAQNPQATEGSDFAVHDDPNDYDTRKRATMKTIDQRRNASSTAKKLLPDEPDLAFEEHAPARQLKPGSPSEIELQVKREFASDEANNLELAEPADLEEYDEEMGGDAALEEEFDAFAKL
jgi:hypothetical protein